MPQTVPEAFTVPTAVLLLTHVPPGVVDDSVVHCPTQVVVVPVSTAGVGLHVTTVFIAQLVGRVYDTVVVPDVRHPSTPEPNPIVPTAGVLLDHAPPAGDPVSVIEELSHNCIGVPLIPVGLAFINTTIVR